MELICDAGPDLVDDIGRVFTARVLFGQDDNVGEIAGDFPQSWALGLIPVASGAEDGD